MYERLLESFGPQHWWPGDTPFEVAVGAVLTQNTNWGNVELAIGNLKRARKLGAKSIHTMNKVELASLIRPAGYFNVKTKRLKNFTGFLLSGYGGSMIRLARKGLSELRHELLQVNGIGPETADSIILYALEKPVFVIDAYTRRVLSRHGVMEAGEDYESFRRLFEENLEHDTQMFNEFHALFVAVGKHYCRPKNPRCSECPIKVDLK
ncbi:MAG: hypothetical protein KAR83_01455 [Thermodesulfovibrionales bacterium]|nr:hypothetical protein [Thermodesulfovibrionales bacterium]